MSNVTRVLFSFLGQLDRRLTGWRRRSQRVLLEREHPLLALAPDVRIEDGVVWRLAQDARVTVGGHTRLRANTELKADAGALLAIGKEVHVGPGCTISALSEVTIGDDCLIAERVSIRDHDHAILDHARPYHAQGYVVQPVHIGRNVWLGGGVTIVKGVTLGDNCVVGANAVVTRSFPANCLVAGVPARLVRMLEPEELPSAVQAAPA